MTAATHRITAAAIVLAALLPFSIAHAQFGDLLKQEQNKVMSGGLANLGNMGGPLAGQSMNSGSASNVAGLLQFCIKNNYLSGNSAASVKDSLMDKLSGGSASPSSDKGYTSGARGILSGSDGGQLNLSGGGLKEKVTRQVCDRVLAQGKSML